ncbi:protein DDI1 homolog 2 isoform X1 [Stigmatopora nigra]
MLVTVYCAPRDRPETTFALDVSPELELRDFVALCELESGIPAGEIQISYVEQPLKDPTRALGTYGVKDGDVVVLRQADRRPPSTQPGFPGLPRIDFRSIAVPGTSTSAPPRSTPRPPPQPAAPPPQQSLPPQQPPAQRNSQPSTPPAPQGSSGSQGLDDPALLQQMLLSNPHELSLLKERNPPLAEALLSGDLERFTKVLLEQQQDRAKREQERIRLLTADPFDLEAQAKIEEDIRQHNVEENMTIAMEEAPESFGQVVMLYINCKVNGHPVKAFVDSGAQMTIMSQACAERCNIMRLVDRRWAGIAKGVGTQKIIGRVHLAQVQIEGDFLPCSFSILEDQPMDMLLGLDMLKRHQCAIDLKKSVLVIGTTGTETRFLSEAELPECARLAYGPEGREESRPEEIADRELAEALQRSVQESDTADGQTTSPPPPPLSLPSASDQKFSSAHPLKPDLVSSESTQILSEPDHHQPPSLEDHSISVEETPEPNQSTEDLQGPHVETTEPSQVEINPILTPSELENSQPMEEEATDPSDSVEMDPSIRDKPEGSDCIPSLAAALLELHELLLSNNCGTPATPGADPSDAKAKLDTFDRPSGGKTEDSTTEPAKTEETELVTQPEPPSEARDLSIYNPEPPEGVHGQTPDIQVPGTPSETPQPVPFPPEHIQRIQAAGFSVRDATEALEQANGVVELALLALLARGITVPN